MLKNILILTTTYIAGISLVNANSQLEIADKGPFTKQKAYMCIQLNKDMNLASEQMLNTESEKYTLKSKIHYLQNAIQERRNLIDELDQRNHQQNNDNYNKLITQYEDLLTEKTETIDLFNHQQELHITQHNSVVRLEERFSSKCLEQVEITQQLYNEVCELENIRWCSAFNFN